VVDFGEDGGDYFMVMEYVRGASLHVVLGEADDRRDSLDRDAWIAVACHVVAEACDGLEAAHGALDASGASLDVVHRDISPQNLMVAYDGSTRVMDFGIAKHAARESRTTTGEMKGKFAYMAPEQIEEGRRVDRRADIWALGVVLWEALTLKRLFRRANEATTLHAVLHHPIAPPSKVSFAPEALDAVVMRALERKPDDRFQTAKELGAALRACAPSASHWDVARMIRALVPETDRDAAPVDVTAATRRDGPRPVDETPPPTPARPRRVLAVAAGLAIVLAAAVVIAAVGLGETPGASTPEVRPPAEARPPEKAQRTRVIVEPPRHEPVEIDPPPSMRPDRVRLPTPSAMRSVEPPPAMVTEPARTEPPIDREPPEAAPGRIFVQVPDSWANVYLDGRFIDATPVRVEAPAGRHRLELRIEGQPPGCQFAVTVVAGEITYVRGCP
jgi:serine/threonine-protein kinase